jgi:hypothetical protein
MNLARLRTQYQIKLGAVAAILVDVVDVGAARLGPKGLEAVVQ